MDDLVTWYRAQLDEDERVARADWEWRETDPWDGTPPLIAAQRAVIDLHPMIAGRCEGCGIETEHPEGCLTIRTLATAYADRPGYQEAWRP